jgi:hypothetical protein
MVIGEIQEAGTIEPLVAMVVVPDDAREAMPEHDSVTPVTARSAATTARSG